MPTTSNQLPVCPIVAHIKHISLGSTGSKTAVSKFFRYSVIDRICANQVSAENILY